jgi:hypothetical protein
MATSAVADFERRGRLTAARIDTRLSSGRSSVAEQESKLIDKITHKAITALNDRIVAACIGVAIKLPLSTTRV